MKLSTYKNGKFSIYRAESEANLLSKWIVNESFLDYEKQNFILNKKSRKRNKLYCFNIDEISQPMTMKVSEVSKDYKFWRRVNVFFTSLYKDYNYNSYKSSILLHKSGVSTLVPIAYWTHKTRGFFYKSYFLYENVASELSVTELVNSIKESNSSNKKQLLDEITNKHLMIIKSIHMANVRHDDPHGGNILTDIKNSDISNLTRENLSHSIFTLIDNDRCKNTKIKFGFLKRFFDLNCLTKFNTKKISDQELVKRYLGADYSNVWLLAFRFWNSGGFSLRKRLYYHLNVKHLYQS